MVVPPPLLTSTPVRREAFQSQTTIRTCSSATRHAELRSFTSHRFVVSNSHRDRLTNGHGVQQTASAVTNRQNRYKNCNDDDVWPTPIPGGLPDGPREPIDVTPSAVCYRTLPSPARRPLGGLDLAKYQIPALGDAPTAGTTTSRRSSPSVFRFDAPHPLTQTDRVDLVDTEPSPIYAEPCDRLTDGLRHRVAVRRCGRRPPTTTETAAVVTPPISAGYRLPRDFLNFATRRSIEQRSSTRDSQPSPLRPPQVRVVINV